MRSTVFHVNNGFSIYRTADDSREIMIAYAGLVTDFLQFKTALEDSERALHLGRMYLFISGLLRLLNREFKVEHKTTWLPNLFYDINNMEKWLTSLSRNVYSWHNGSELDVKSLEEDLNGLLMNMSDLCKVLLISPYQALDIAKVSFEMKIEKLKEVIIVQPPRRGRGRPKGVTKDVMAARTGKRTRISIKNNEKIIQEKYLEVITRGV
jgi:hypothetical protein